jgi:hypothetical protein
MIEFISWEWQLEAYLFIYQFLNPDRQGCNFG